MAKLNEIIEYCNSFLQTSYYNDVSYNGLQVEGSRTEIKKIVTGVTANEALITAALKSNADMVLVHHGIYWKGTDPRLVGVLGKRVKALQDASLVAYHLPLDGNLTLGNNYILANNVELLNIRHFTVGRDTNIAVEGEYLTPVSVVELNAKLSALLECSPLIMGPQDKEIRKVAICSGGGGFLLEHDLTNIDAVIVGEVHEQHYHLAQELNITTFVVGHHRSEICGIKALGEHLAEKFEIENEFINIDCPI